MHQPRLRQLMIAIGVASLALALAVLMFFLHLWWRLHSVYGPGGELDRERRRAGALPRGEGLQSGQGELTLAPAMPHRGAGTVFGPVSVSTWESCDDETAYFGPVSCLCEGCWCSRRWISWNLRPVGAYGWQPCPGGGRDRAAVLRTQSYLGSYEGGFGAYRSPGSIPLMILAVVGVHAGRTRSSTRLTWVLLQRRSRRVLCPWSLRSAAIWASDLPAAWSSSMVGMRWA
jgi:hypothetical protein